MKSFTVLDVAYGLIPEFTVIVERQRTNVSCLRAPHASSTASRAAATREHKTAIKVVSSRRHVFRIR